jgi:hypothetical protein
MKTKLPRDNKGNHLVVNKMYIVANKFNRAYCFQGMVFLGMSTDGKDALLFRSEYNVCLNYSIEPDYWLAHEYFPTSI